VSGFDRVVLGALGFMVAAVPLEGTFGVLDPLRPPIPPLVGVAGAIAIGCAMLAAAALAALGAIRRPPRRVLIAAQLFPGAAIALAAALGFDPPTGFLLAAIVFGLGAVGIAIDRYAALPGALGFLLGAFLAAGTAAAVLAIAMVVLRLPAAVYAYNNGRAVGIFLNANECAAYQLVLLAAAGGTLACARGRALRVVAGAAAISGAAALALSFSRWGYASALAGFAAYALAARDRRALLALGAATALAAGLVLGPGNAHHNPRDDAARVVAWTTGVRTFLHFPLSGAGPFAFNRLYDVLRPPEAPGAHTPVAYDPHSLPLAFAAGSGLGGLLALVFGNLVYARAIVRTLRGASPARRTLALALSAGLVALSVHVLLNTISLYFALAAQTLALALAAAGSDLEPHAA
jgi:hypothetical protein